MKIKTFLVAIKKKKNDGGSSGKSQRSNDTHLMYNIGCVGDSYLGFRVREKNVDLKVRTDIEVVSEFWDDSTMSYKRTRKLPSEYITRVNTLVKDITDTIASTFDVENADADWVRSVVAECKLPKPKASDKPTFVDRYEQYLSEHTMTKNSREVYVATLKKFKRYIAYQQEVEGDKGFCLYVETITTEDYRDFEDYMRHEHELLKEYPEFYGKYDVHKKALHGLSNTTIVYMTRNLRTVHHWCINKGYTDNKSCDKFPNADPSYGTPIYITLEERDKIYNADLSKETESIQVARDMFVFQSLIGCRVRDLFSFTKANINDGVLTYVPHKTRLKKPNPVHIPLNKKALALLRKYHEPDDRLFPKIGVSTSTSTFNVNIKKIFRLCGINRMVTIQNPQTGKDEQVPICDIASSHMARRTFIGNLYKKVKDPELICSMTGHTKGARSFTRYREIDDDIKTELVNLIN